MKKGDYIKRFKDKKITMLGLGLLGRGINVARFLAESDADLTITDLKYEEELKTSIKKLSKYTNIVFHLGGHNKTDFRNADMIPLDSPYIKEAKKNNIPIEMDASLFAMIAPKGVKIVGVTGTRGKSTVTHLIYHILSGAVSSDKGNIFIAGNIREVATLPLLKKIRTGDIVILELDSWQLQGFGDAKISPNIAVFTNFMRDHMNYYDGDMKQYFKDKANIFKYQKKEDLLFVGKDISKKYKLDARSTKLATVPKTWKSKLLGNHNLENITLAVSVCEALAVSMRDIKKGVETFAGVPGRLEYICEKRDIKYYNDTTATTPDALQVALQSLVGGKKKNIILIAGGNDKKLDYKEVAGVINKTVKSLILFGGTATQKLLKLIDENSENFFDVRNLSVVDNMKDAVSVARNVAKSGDIILLSPGATSFGIFKNEFDRGEQFVKLVKSK